MKTKVGTLYGKPIVEGNASLVTKNEIYLQDSKSLTLKVRDSQGELQAPRTSDFTEEHTMLYWCQSSSSLRPRILVDLVAEKAKYFWGPTLCMDFDLPIRASHFPWAKGDIGSSPSSAPIGLDTGGRGILNSKNTPKSPEYNIVSNPSTGANSLPIGPNKFPAEPFGTKSSQMSNYMNIEDKCTDVYGVDGTYWDLRLSRDLSGDFSGAFYVAHDAWLVGPGGKLIKIQEYVEPEETSYSLRPGSKSYRVRLMESLIEEAQNAEEPDEDYILNLMAIKEVYAEEDAAKRGETSQK